MALSPEDKEDRARDRMLEKAKEYQTGTYVRKFVAPIFQRMIRAEAAAQPADMVTAIKDGTLHAVTREVGQCVCVTCGKAQRWNSGIKGMHTGHFLASRRNSILFEEYNVAPQCSSCNYYLSGAPQEFRQWMIYVRGIEVVEHLERLKTKSVSFTRWDLVDMRIKYKRRLDEAVKIMQNVT